MKRLTLSCSSTVLCKWVIISLLFITRTFSVPHQMRSGLLKSSNRMQLDIARNINEYIYTEASNSVQPTRAQNINKYIETEASNSVLYTKSTNEYIAPGSSDPEPSSIVHRTQTLNEYIDTDADPSTTVLDIRRYNERNMLKRRTKRNSCDEESLNNALMSCQESVTLTNAHMADMDLNQTALLRTQFCGIGCRTKMFLHARQCGISSYIVEVSGDCSYRKDTTCIHAAVIMLEGVLWCSIEIDQGHVEDAVPTTDASQSPESNPTSSTHQCSLSTSYSMTVNHRFLYDKQGRQVLSPPLEPPWQNCSAFSFNNASFTRTTEIVASTNAPPSSAEGGETPSSNTVTQNSFISTTTSKNRSQRLNSHIYSLLFMSIMCSLVLSKVFL